MEDEVVVVPVAEDMEDETFLKHIEKRHAKDCKLEGTSINRKAMEAWVPTWRAYHERLHKIAHPGQYDHEHDYEDEVDE